MANTEELHKIIDYAINNKGALQILYVNNNGYESRHVLDTFRWMNDTVFVAYSHSRKEVRPFYLGGILKWQYHESLPDTPTTKPIERPIPPQPSHNESPVTKSSNARPLFRQVTTDEEWARLVNYYADCVIRETRQRFVLSIDNLCQLRLNVDQILKFQEAQISLEFKGGNKSHQDQIARFIDLNRQKTHMQLCLGYPFLVMDTGKIAPLIYSPVTIIENQDNFLLRSEGFEVSYAALHILHLTEEEIEQFLIECDDIQAAPGQPIIQSLQAKVIAKINEIFDTVIEKRTDHIELFTIFDCPALFWVSGDAFTRNLIKELRDLADSRKWLQTPSPLKQLLSVIPDHDYLGFKSTNEDHELYVTAVNQQQIRATQAARIEPILIVTGPPGTGKSQLVLNLVVQAFLHGEKVLFASRNNKAVDVVMNRLQSELGFQGAVRTGNTRYREKAVQKMRAALSLVGMANQPFSIESLQEAYQTAREKENHAQNELENVRRLSGLLQSYQHELEKYLSFIPKEFRKIIKTSIPEYQVEEADNLHTTLTNFLEYSLLLKEFKANLEQRTLEIAISNTIDSELVEELYHFEDQWGSFGGGFLRPRKFDTLADLDKHIQTWIDLVDVLELRALIEDISRRRSELGKQFSEQEVRLSEKTFAFITRLVEEQPLPILEEYSNQVEDLHKCFSKYASRNMGILEKIWFWVSHGSPLKKAVGKYYQIASRARVRLDIPFVDDIRTQAKLCETTSIEFLSLLRAAQAKQKITTLNAELEIASTSFVTRKEALPEQIRNDLTRLKLSGSNNSALKDALFELLGDIHTLQQETDTLAERINNKLDDNDDHIEMLDKFRENICNDTLSFWRISFPAEPAIIADRVMLWRNFVSCWSSDAGVRHVLSQLNQLPSETEAIEFTKETATKLLELSGELMRKTWLNRAKQATNEVFQGAHDYVTAVEKLLENFDTSEYSRLKSIEQSNLRYAAQIFPIWATTNLTAKTNFPLVDGFFDLVIIDEASQCDVASALPLLYRAKHIVIIGDPNQLRHVASLSTRSEKELANLYGVDSGAFSYNTHSLFDLAQRSAGTHPGTLLLNEHYRSDARIIGFSNREFYNNELIIKTDLSVKGIQKSLLNSLGGIYWLHVDGAAEYPRGGSVLNEQELIAIQELTPRILDQLRDLEIGQVGVGIVTPYRAHEERIQSWINSHYGSVGKLMAGTAHKFQGDERDFIIFSTVLAKGLSEGSINWLQKTKNLLNVAVTRGRLALFIVGDWEYCLTLSEDHVFRHLAEYVGHESDRIARSVDELTFFGQRLPKIIGFVTDPHNPEYNRTTLRRFIASCSEYIWWVDVYLHNHIFDLFMDIFQDSTVNIREVLLLTSLQQTEQTEDSRPKISLSRFRRLQSELLSRGINIQLRVLDRRNLPHDRFLYSPGQAINMPPFGGAYGDHRHVSEYTQSLTSPGLFKKYWDIAQEV